MADNQTTLSLLVLAQEFRGDIVNQINRVAQFLKFIPIVAGSGKNVAWAASADGTLVENYSEGADASNFGGESQDAATLSWALYRANPKATKLAQDAAASSSSPMGNNSVWVKEIKTHAAALAKKVNQECFAGPGTGTRIAGLDVAIATDNNTYAGIDRTDAAKAYWKPTVVDPGVDTAPTLAMLRDDSRKVLEASGERPDLAMTCPSVFNAVGNLFDATRRQVEASVASTARGKVTLEAGFHALELDGMPIVMDVDATKTATSGTMYYLNTNYVELQYLPDAEQMAMLKEVGMKVRANDGFGEVPLGFTYEKLAKTGPTDKAEILSTTQLKVTRPNACGARMHIQF